MLSKKRENLKKSRNKTIKFASLKKMNLRTQVNKKCSSKKKKKKMSKLKKSSKGGMLTTRRLASVARQNALRRAATKRAPLMQPLGVLVPGTVPAMGSLGVSQGMNSTRESEFQNYYKSHSFETPPLGTNTTDPTSSTVSQKSNELHVPSDQLASISNIEMNEPLTLSPVYSEYLDNRIAEIINREEVSNLSKVKDLEILGDMYYSDMFINLLKGLKEEFPSEFEDLTIDDKQIMIDGELPLEIEKIEDPVFEQKRDEALRESRENLQRLIVSPPGITRRLGATTGIPITNIVPGRIPGRERFFSTHSTGDQSRWDDRSHYKFKNPEGIWHII